MPRPTVAQLAYGSCTVIFSTLAMLLLSRVTSVPGIAAVAVAALALGLSAAVIAGRSKPAARPLGEDRSGSEPAPPEREQLAA